MANYDMIKQSVTPKNIYLEVNFICSIMMIAQSSISTIQLGFRDGHFENGPQEGANPRSFLLAY